jgi:hypothetical protein
MQNLTSKNAPPQAPSRGALAVWIALGGLVVLAAVALLWLTRSHAPVAAAPRKAAHVVAKGTYRNRALLPGPTQDAPQAQPTIMGNVYGTDGNPIVGATVTAATFDSTGNVPSTAGAVKSDEHGRFQLSLPAGTYQLNGAMTGYGPTSATAQTGDTVSLVLPKSGVLEGHITDTSGKPVRRFTIDIVSVVPGDAPAPPPVWSKTFNTEDGAFRADQVPAWPVIVRATADDHAPAISQPVNVHSGDTRQVDLSMDEGCTLTGVVQDRKGSPLSGILVNAEERVTAGSMADPTAQASTQAQSDSDGSFTLEHVPTGTVLVRGYDGDYAVTTVTVKIMDCAKLPAVKMVMSAGGNVAGTARRADGSALPGARLSINDRSIGFVNVLSDREGHFHFDRMPGGPVRMELESDGQRVIRYVVIEDGKTVTQDMQLFGTGKGELRGRVTAGKKPLAGVRILVASNHGQEQGIGMYFPVTGADGSFKIDSIPEGNYLVSAMSTMAGTGVKVDAGEVANVELDASFMPPVGPQAPHLSRRAHPQPAPGDAPTPSP